MKKKLGKYRNISYPPSKAHRFPNYIFAIKNSKDISQTKPGRFLFRLNCVQDI